MRAMVQNGVVGEITVDNPRQSITFNLGVPLDLQSLIEDHPLPRCVRSVFDNYQSTSSLILVWLDRNVKEPGYSRAERYAAYTKQSSIVDRFRVSSGSGTGLKISLNEAGRIGVQNGLVIHPEIVECFTSKDEMRMVVWIFEDNDCRRATVYTRLW